LSYHQAVAPSSPNLSLAPGVSHIAAAFFMCCLCFGLGGGAIWICVVAARFGAVMGRSPGRVAEGAGAD
jgi:hypothetical protein